MNTPSRRGTDKSDLFGSNISSADSSTSSQIRTRNTFIEVTDDGEQAYLEHVKSSRSHSMPQLVTKEQQFDLASFLLEQIRTSGLIDPHPGDITRAVCATVENMLPMCDRENWSNSKIYRILQDRGFDAEKLITKIEILNSFGKVKLKFVDHASLVSFKLLFDQSSFDGKSPCCVKIVDCCCPQPGDGDDPYLSVPRVAEPPPLDILLGQTKEQPSSNRLFVGGLSAETTDSSLRSYFEQYGDLVEATVILDKRSKQSRGFGFIAFAFGHVPENILVDQHIIDNKTVGVRLYGKGRE